MLAFINLAWGLGGGEELNLALRLAFQPHLDLNLLCPRLALNSGIYCLCICLSLYILHSWEIIYFQTHIFRLHSHSLKGCPEGHSTLPFCWDVTTPSPPQFLLSLIIMEALTLAERTFLEGGTWKCVHYHSNKPYAHSSHQHLWSSTHCSVCSTGRKPCLTVPYMVKLDSASICVSWGETNVTKDNLWM